MVNINKIRALAKENGRSMSYLISAIGLNARTYFNDIEKNGRDIPDKYLIIIADILHTTPEYLRDETEVKEKASTDSEDVSVNTVIMRSRDGSVIKRRLSDEQVRALQTIIGQLPDAPDDL